MLSKFSLRRLVLFSLPVIGLAIFGLLFWSLRSDSAMSPSAQVSQQVVTLDQGQPINSQDLQNVASNAVDLLDLSLTSVKDQYLLGEPVILTVTAANETDQMVEWHSYIEPIEGFIELTIAYNNGLPQKYIGPTWGLLDIGTFEPTIFVPGEKVSTTMTVYYNAIQTGAEHLDAFLAFAEPGEYTLQATMLGFEAGQELHSAPHTIRVAQPSGDNAKVWNLLRTPDVARALQANQLDDNRVLRSELNSLLVRYPDSAYSEYIRGVVADKVMGVEEQPVPTVDDSRLEATVQRDVAIDFIEAGENVIAVRTFETLSERQSTNSAEQIIELVTQWVAAYNDQNIPQFVELFSFDTTIRQKWEQGPGDRDHESILTRFQDAYTQTGPLTIEIVRLNIGTDMVTADVVGSFAQDEVISFEEMKFVRDDDGVWRILEGGF